MSIIDKLFKKEEDKLDYPWEKFYKKEDRHPEVPDLSIYEYFEGRAQLFLDDYALNYFGVKTTFKDLLDKIDICAKAMRSQGVRKNDVVTICMPNTPEALIALYATNKIGAIANMLHPLSSEEEIKYTLKATNTVLLITINITFDKIKNIIEDIDNVYKVVVVSPKESMPPLLGLGYMLTKEMSLNIPKDDEFFTTWTDFFAHGYYYKGDVLVHRGKDDRALYLHSGGTTGSPKHIIISNGNVNLVMKQIPIMLELGVGDVVLGILPMFHCFGLVACMLGLLCQGVTVAMIPQFDAKRFDKLIRKYKPTIIGGVPTLFQALMTNPYMMNVDMSFVRYVVSGGDSLSPEKNIAVNKFLEEHGSKAHIIQGYGLTESTGGSCIAGLGSDKPGSVGIPLAGNVFKIMDPETFEEKACGEIGEICISGDCVMQGYLDNEEETNKVVRVHEDGRRWVHTGDLGYMDSDGVFFFVQRLKRMLIVSGYNVYPAHIENILLEHPDIANVGVIGIPHPYKVQVPKAFIVLKEGVEGDAQKILDIKEYCAKNMAKYMIPKEIEFRESLPKTLVGKVDYKELEKENAEK